MLCVFVFLSTIVAVLLLHVFTRVSGEWCARVFVLSSLFLIRGGVAVFFVRRRRPLRSTLIVTRLRLASLVRARRGVVSCGMVGGGWGIVWCALVWSGEVLVGIVWSAACRLWGRVGNACDVQCGILTSFGVVCFRRIGSGWRIEWQGRCRYCTVRR